MPASRELSKDDLLTLRNYLRATKEVSVNGDILLKPHIFEALLKLAFKAVDKG